MQFSPPKVPLYSCATAAPMPADPDEIRGLAADQWRSRVRFTETIERMYADGFRTFVEVGPSANLTGFIENVLQGHDFLAVPLDSRRRSSLVQLLHSLGRLWVSGHGWISPDWWPTGRSRPSISTAPRPARPRGGCSRTCCRSCGCPRPRSRRSGEPPAAGCRCPAVRPTPPSAAGAAASAGRNGGTLAPAQAGRANGGYAAARLPGCGQRRLSGHFALMQQFLDLQNSVMTAALSGPAPTPRRPYPFLHRIVTRDEDRLLPNATSTSIGTSSCATISSTPRRSPISIPP